MKLIVGLGNPGKEYENTRHNIGFMMIDYIIQELNITKSSEKMGGKYFETNINGEKVIFLKPQQYINLSGDVIIRFMNFYKIEKEDIFIIHDDLDLEVGKFKLREKGGSGGHNGLKNIESHLKSKEYNRMKIGISNNKNIDTKDYVLGRLNKEEKEKLNEIIKLGPNIIKDYLTISFTNLMNKYNK